MLVIILVSIAVFYVMIAAFKGEKGLPLVQTRLLRGLAILLSGFILLIFFAAKSGYYFNCYWPPRLLFWGWYFALLILYGFGSRTILTKIEIWLYAVVSFFPLFLAAILIIPFVGLGFSMALYPSLIGDREMIVYADTHVRIEQQHLRFIGPDPPLEVFKKTGLWAKKIGVLPIAYNDATDSVAISRVPDSLVVLYYTKDNWAFPEGVARFSVPF